MKVQKIDGRTEKRILTAMIVSREVLGAVSLRWHPDLFRSRWANMVGGWAVRHWTKFQSVPGKEIQSHFDRWSRKASDEKMIGLVESFLSHLSEEFERESEDINSEYVLDMAGEYFHHVQLERLSDNLQDDLLDGRISEAGERVAGFRKIEIGLGTGITLADSEAIEAAFSEKNESVVSYPGALGEFFGPYLERDGFVAFMGPEKRGKSFWLMDIVYRAITQRKKVAWFEVGDMSQAQALRRLMVRISKTPLKAGVIQYPRQIEKTEDENGRDICEVNFDEKIFESGLSPAKAKAAAERLMNRRGGEGLKMCCYPNGSISVAGIRETIGVWENDGWVPDIVVIDYADILDMALPGVSDVRHQINESWKALRRLSQELHCLVVTATQTDAASYDSGLILRRHFSEDKRKFAHVTGMIGLNQTPEEKARGMMRLNWVLRRDGEYQESRTVKVAGCLALANPAVKSTW